MATDVDKLSVDDATKEHVRHFLNAVGTWSYNAGTGTSTDSSTGRIIGVLVIAPVDAACAFSISGGVPITVPSGSVVEFAPSGMTKGTVEIMNSASWVVERVI